MNPNDTFMENYSETLELLIATHFLACKDKASEESEPEDNSAPSDNACE